MDKELESKIERFLSEPVFIEAENTRSVAHSTDVEILREIITMICIRKWQQNKRGYLPVQFTVVNRSTHEPIQYGPQPRKTPSISTQFEYKFNLAKFNAAIADEEMKKVFNDENTRSHAKITSLIEELEVLVTREIDIRDRFQELEDLVVLPPIELSAKAS